MDVSNKKWFRRYLIAYLVTIVTLILIGYVVDPYIHFHKPVEGISHRFAFERYVNDGIARNIDCEAVIIGTSMTQNFKPSEWEEYTGEKTIKLTMSGGSFLEEKEQLERAFKYNKGDIKTVIWGMDYDSMIRPYDFMTYDGLPTYLYDDNIFNDVSYVLNKDILVHGTLADLILTARGESSATPNNYSSWDVEGGFDEIIANYDIPHEQREMKPGLTDEEAQMVLENVRRNFSELADAHPEVTFIIFYPPYSLIHWDRSNMEGMTVNFFEAEKIATEELLKHDNIRLYSFFDNFELTCNFDNYRDPEHYIMPINSWILEQFLTDEWLVTKENYLDRMKVAHDFYGNYDFSELLNKEQTEIE